MSSSLLVHDSSLPADEPTLHSERPTRPCTISWCLTFQPLLRGLRSCTRCFSKTKLLWFPIFSAQNSYPAGLPSLPPSTWELGFSERFTSKLTAFGNLPDNLDGRSHPFLRPGYLCQIRVKTNPAHTVFPPDSEQLEARNFPHLPCGHSPWHQGKALL